jgi:uncharacterized ferredoxin-like protein
MYSMLGEGDAVEVVASLMALSARTAPKGRGVDALVIRIVAGPELAALAGKMREIGERIGMGFFFRDALNVSQSAACVLVGVKGASTAGLNCGGCGYPDCAGMLASQGARGTPFSGPTCAIRITDLGIAVGSAVKTASIHNVDNRIMYTAGVGALSLGWLDGCSIAYGIPLQAAGKSIFFDRTS